MTDTNTCSICLEEVESDASKYCPPCGHGLHVDCAMNNALSGNIGCPVCRRVPLANYNAEDVAFQREEAIIIHNTLELKRCFLLGLQKARAKKGHEVLKHLVSEYKLHEADYKRRIDTQKKESQLVRGVRTKWLEDIKSLNASRPKKYRIPISKVTSFTKDFHGTKWVSQFLLQRARRRIAEAAGLKELPMPNRDNEQLY